MSRADQVAGRVEHVVSGQSAHFDSLEELLAFLAQVLTTVRAPPRSKKREWVATYPTAPAVSADQLTKLFTPNEQIVQPIVTPMQSRRSVRGQGKGGEEQDESKGKSNRRCVAINGQLNLSTFFLGGLS